MLSQSHNDYGQHEHIPSTRNEAQIMNDIFKDEERLEMGDVC